jgi:CheY-like chemotaxis protein
MLGIAIGRARDMERLRTTNEALERTTVWAQEMASEAIMANAAKSTFLASMSHEIRTPMSGVLGMLDLLRDTTLTDDQREMVELAYHSAEGLLEILNEVLDFSKIESGNLVLEETDFDLAQVVESATELLAARADVKQLDLVTLIENDAPAALRGDPVRLRQVLINLVGNAVKFTDQGEILVRVSVVEQDESGARLRFAISDTGIGMSEEACARLFQPFTQAEDSITRRFGGTGLGLVISRRLVEAMGGEIDVESTAGKGSTFRFTARLGKRSGAPACAPADPEPWPAARVLIVEDGAASREALRYQVSALGMEPEVAPDLSAARDALRRAVEEGAGCRFVLLDCGISGALEFSRELSADPAHGSIDVVLLATFGQQRRGADDFGTAPHLLKPVRRGALEHVLRARLESARAQAPGTGAGPGADAPACRPEARPGRGSLRPGIRVLLAEDNPVNQMVARRMLERIGVEVRVVGTGRMAVDAARQGSFDLILMDHQMPEMDGCEAARAIREWECEARSGRGSSSATGSGPHVPIVAMTASVAPTDKDRCLKSGMDDYLPKPIDPDRLRETIRRWARADAGPGRGSLDRAA